MPVFNRIFNFDQAAVTGMEQRLNTRYVPGAAFPLQAWLLSGTTEWPAKIRDISGNGINLLLEPEAALAADAPVRVRLRFGAHQQLISAKLVHHHAESSGLDCGLGLVFADFAARKTYLQLLQPVAIGQSLQRVPDDQVTQDEPLYLKCVYGGDDESALTVWLQNAPGNAPYSFEFQMKNYCCRPDIRTGALTTSERHGRAGKSSNPVFAISGTLDAEIRQLFRWTLPNLAAAVPEDVRVFLQRFAS